MKKTLNNDTIEQIYEREAIKALREKVERNDAISDYKRNQWLAAFSEDERKELSLEKFIVCTSGWDIIKCNLGEKAQTQYLRTKFPNYIRLAGAGAKAVRLCKDNGKYVLKETKSKGNKDVLTVKSMDGMVAKQNKQVFFLLKTVDLSPFSTSLGGGHQDNVKNEMRIFCQAVANKNVTYNGKATEFWIVIDGKSAKPILDDLKNEYANCSSIKFYTSSEL